VPARSGSKGIPDKNMQRLAGTSLIGWAGICLAHTPMVDARLISTDSATYAEEGMRHGMAAPWLRPAELSGDTATAMDVMRHAMQQGEAYYGGRFDLALIIEPTSPLRFPDDLEQCVRTLLASEASSAVTVSELPSQAHPLKLLRITEGGLVHDSAGGEQIAARQQLPRGLYYRNGICYALTRSCVLDDGRIFTSRTVAHIIHRPVANIDALIDLEWAEFLLNTSTYTALRALRT
jgi:CMP-N-acetylneuraminic acid synthetase